MAIKQNFPDIKPSLNLDFANTKSLDPRIDFTRASTATYYDGQTFAKAEENLLLRSQDFGANWSDSGISIESDASTAPDGSTTADKIVEDTSSGIHRLTQGINDPPSTLTFSLRVKPDSRDFITLSLSQGFTQRFVSATYDMTSSGTVSQTAVGSGQGDLVSTSIKQINGGFFEISITGSAGNITVATHISLSNSATPSLDDFGRATYTGDGSSGLFIWGAQLEQRDQVTAYTPTTDQPITNYIPVLETASTHEPRFDHDPVTGESKGLLIEEQRTNLFTYSEQFDDAAWVKQNAVIQSNQIIAPDGTLTGDKLVENTTTSNHDIYQNVSVVPTSYASSYFLKAGERTKVAFRNGASNVGIINLVTGVFESLSGLGSPQIQNAGNGWFRVSATRANGDTVTRSFGVYLLDGSGNASYTGDGYSGIYIWGAQIEES